MVCYFLGKSLKLMPPDALISAQNAPKCVWRPGSARTRSWGSLSAPPDPLAAKRGPTSKGRGREGRGREGRGERGQEEGRGGRGWEGGGGDGRGGEGERGKEREGKGKG